MKNKKILEIGAIVVAKTNRSMEIGDRNQFLTKDKEYKIIDNPEYYDNPIVILDDEGYNHACPTSWFK